MSIGRTLSCLPCDTNILGLPRSHLHDEPRRIFGRQRKSWRRPASRQQGTSSSHPDKLASAYGAAHLFLRCSLALIATETERCDNSCLVHSCAIRWLRTVPCVELTFNSPIPYNCSLILDMSAAQAKCKTRFRRGSIRDGCLATVWRPSDRSKNWIART